MADERGPLQPVPTSRTLVKRQTRISLVWIVPIVAAVAGAWVAITRVMSEGPKIVIVFQSAEGLEAGKTKIHYKGVDVGTLTTIRLSDDHKRVIATAEMAPRSEAFLVEDTRFWVVRPRISGANVTGLGTLISGSYIAMDIGTSTESKRDFVAVETPPIISGDTPGRFFILKTGDLGSLDSGTPIFFRRLQVGQVAGYELDKSGQLFTIKIFVQAPYDQYVTPNTHFWQASGVDMELSASGLSLRTQSLLSILIGGVAFETPATGTVLQAADANTVFTLYATRAEAYEPPARYPQTYELFFKQSVRGLAVGAPVEFHGIQIGEVAEIRALFDLKTMEFAVPVTIHIDPQRLGVRLVDVSPGEDPASFRRRVIDSLVTHGVRAQLRTGNLLTGSVYVAFDFFPGIQPAQVDWNQQPVQLPTTPGELEATEAKLTHILDKLDQVPLKEIGDNLQKSLGTLTLTLKSAQTTLDNANRYVEPESAQGQELDSSLQEVGSAARSVRVLADYLERHPEALLRGKQGAPK
jgi:paraquat-inducible protein B